MPLPGEPLRVLCVSGSTGRGSRTRLLLSLVAAGLHRHEWMVDDLDLSRVALPLLDDRAAHRAEAAVDLRDRVDRADAVVLATPSTTPASPVP